MCSVFLSQHLLGGFHISAIVGISEMLMGVQISLLNIGFISFIIYSCLLPEKPTVVKSVDHTVALRSLVLFSVTAAVICILAVRGPEFLFCSKNESTWRTPFPLCCLPGKINTGSAKNKHSLFSIPLDPYLSLFWKEHFKAWEVTRCLALPFVFLMAYRGQACFPWTAAHLSVFS